MKTIKSLQMTFVILIVMLLSIHCAKRQTQPAPTANDEKVEIDKNQFLQFINNDMKINEEDAEKARFQTETIMPGDRISIIIYEKLPVSDEKRIEVKRVNESGTILLLPIGEINIQGLRVSEAEQLIEKQFSKMVVSPQCEIQITEKQYTPRVYVFGEVLKAGSVNFRPGDRLLDALSAVQGCSENAYRRSIKVIRFEKENISIYSINLYDIFESGNLYKNIQLQDKDIVFIPRRFITGFKEVFTALSLVMPYWVLVQGISKNF